MKMGNLGEIIQDMQNGVYNFTDSGKCSSCGNCCSNILPMSKDELKRIKKYVRKHHIQDTSKNEQADINMVCPFRDNEKRICTIYKVRPLICSDFKCDKPQKQIKATRDFMYDRFMTVLVREEIFGKGKNAE